MAGEVQMGKEKVRCSEDCQKRSKQGTIRFNKKSRSPGRHPGKRMEVGVGKKETRRNGLEIKRKDASLTKFSGLLMQSQTKREENKSEKRGRKGQKNSIREREKGNDFHGSLSDGKDDAAG